MALFEPLLQSERAGDLCHELKTLVQDTVRGLMARGKTQVKLAASDLDLFAESLRGLTLFEAERALYRAAVDDLALTPADREGLIDFKKQVIERDGHLEFWPRLDDLAAVGGLEKLKAWLARRRNAFSDAEGIAEATWVLGPEEGPQKVRAVAVGGTPMEFDATAVTP